MSHMVKDVKNNVFPGDHSDKLFDFLPCYSLEQKWANKWPNMMMEIKDSSAFGKTKQT